MGARNEAAQAKATGDAAATKALTAENEASAAKTKANTVANDLLSESARAKAEVASESQGRVSGDALLQGEINQMKGGSTTTLQALETQLQTITGQSGGIASAAALADTAEKAARDNTQEIALTNQQLDTIKTQLSALSSTVTTDAGKAQADLQAMVAQLEGAI